MKYKESDYMALTKNHLFYSNRNDSYRSAEWLLNSFHENIWECSFSEQYNLQIDFNVKLTNSCLTDAQNSDLLDFFKCWLCMQTHTDSTNGIVLAPATAMKKITMTLHIIDYFLLNSEELMLEKHGLSLLSFNDIKGFFLALATSREISHGIYNWPARLSNFLKTNIAEISDDDVNNIMMVKPSILTDIPAEEERLLCLDEFEIKKSRIWLYLNNYYRFSRKEDYRYSIKTVAIAKEIFKNTLRGQTHKLLPEELNFDPIERYSREYKSAPVRTNNENKLSLKKFNIYFNLFERIFLLENAGITIPKSALALVNYQAIASAINLKSIGRFVTLPVSVVISSLNYSIDYFINYGEDLLESYLILVKSANELNMSCLEYSKAFGLESILTTKLKELGVKEWTIDSTCRCVHINEGRYSKDEYFSLLRDNVGLWELIRVLYGAILICIGSLMARRVNEIASLRYGRSLDVLEENLVFFNQKSGFGEIKEIIARPLPSIAVKMIKLIERLHDGLIDLGLLKKGHLLFCHPSLKDISLVNYIKYSSNLDFFCDYFELPLDNYGRRYYIRQHQLRRFFAMLFFWNYSYGGLDTLRWFLGHNDVEHVYRYISESTPGEVLKSIKSQYVIDTLKSDQVPQDLTDLLFKHFGTKNFSVININELDNYLESLIDAENLVVEPVFFDSPDGKSYRVIVTLNGNEL